MTSKSETAFAALYFLIASVVLFTFCYVVYEA